MQLQRAFVTRQFKKVPEGSHQDANLTEAIKVLLQMDSRTGYPQLLGYKLANRILDNAGESQKLREQIDLYVSLYESLPGTKERAELCEICSEFQIVVKISELAI